MGKAQEFPLGECFGNFELDPHRSISVGRQLRIKERGLLEIRPRGDLVEAGGPTDWSARLWFGFVTLRVNIAFCNLAPTAVRHQTRGLWR